MEFQKNRNLAQNPLPLYFLYDLAVRLASVFLHIPAVFSPKIRSFLRGRRGVKAYLESFREPGRPLIWMHTASLGEFEQGLPVLERLMAAYPGHQFLVTFFSPSGYEVKKGKVPGAGTCYLPLDTRQNVREFLDGARPDIALFVKYEVWPNFFAGLRSRDIPLVLFSARFRERQVFFQWYGGLMRRALQGVRQFYVQDPLSASLLNGIGIHRIAVCGDTRLDRVMEIRSRDNRLDFMEAFVKGRNCLVAGSTWPEDEKAILPFVRARAGATCCAVIAPHKTDSKTVGELMKRLGSGAVTYSEWSKRLEEAGGLASGKSGDTPREPGLPAGENILVIDTIGLLTRIYSYADLAYVGGGFATGLHNTLEPAVFGIPVLIGPRYAGFREAEALVETGGILPVAGPLEFEETAGKLLDNATYRRQIGAINRDYIDKNAGASIQILAGIRKLIG